MHPAHPGGMSTPMNPGAEGARESARQDNGQFGAQHRAEADVDLMAVHRAGETGYYDPTDEEVEHALAHYEKALLWSSMVTVEEDDDPIPADDFDGELSAEARESMTSDVRDFLSSNKALIDAAERLKPGYTVDQAMHDFALTRNRHGAGFWDRGLDQIGTELTDSAHAYGESDVYVGDDGLLYV